MRRPDVPIVGDCRLVIEELTKAIAQRGGPESRADITPWRSTISGWQERYPLVYEQSEAGDLLKPQYVLEQLRDRSPSDCIVASGVGQHQMWTSQYWHFNHPYTWINSGGLGTMGFSVPAAIGAKVGRPDRIVWAIDGDGCFQMTAQELVTATTERIPVKIAILNNAYLGMVRQWQEMFYEERYSEVYLSPDLPDYVKWAEAMGCVAHACRVPRRGRPGDRQGERDQRPTGRAGVPHRLRREGLPDGPLRRVEQRHRRRPHPAGARTMNVRGAGGSRTREVRHHVLSVLVENRAGVLARVSALFARRGYNIYSLAVAPTDDARFSRITVVVDVESAPLEQVVKQLNKLVNVIKISELDPRDSVERELMLVTVRAPAGTRSEIIELVGVFDGRIIDVGHDELTISLDEHPDRLDDLEQLLAPTASSTCSERDAWHCPSSSGPRFRVSVPPADRRAVDSGARSPDGGPSAGPPVQLREPARGV